MGSKVVSELAIKFMDEDKYIRKIGEGIYLTDLTDVQKLQELKLGLDSYIKLCNEDIEYSESSEEVTENHRKITLYIAIIQIINNWLQNKT